MILYDNRNVIAILWRRSGSVIWMRSVQIPALMSTILCVAFLLVPHLKAYLSISLSVARIYASVIGFSIVMRTSMAFGRFFEGVAEVTLMFSKWRDAYCAMMVFMDVSIAEHVKRGNVIFTNELVASKARLLHWFSLLTALAVERMQTAEEDGYLELNVREELNSVIGAQLQAEYFDALYDHCIKDPPTPDPQETGAVEAPAGEAPVIHANSNDGRPFAHSYGHRIQKKSLHRKSRARVTSHVPPGLPVPPKQAHSFRSSGSSSQAQNFSQGHTSGSSRTYDTMQQDPSGLKFGTDMKEGDDRLVVLGTLTRQEEEQLSHCVDPVHTVLKWILFEVSRHQISSTQLIPPPILARVYQELSNGMVGYFLALKIADVPFPFPFAQFLQWALYAFLMMTPLVVLHDIDDEISWELHWLSPIINYLACVGTASLNEIAAQLEEPFGCDDNDYPVHIQQWDVVRSLEDCYYQRRPLDFNIDRFHNLGDGGAMTHLLQQADAAGQRVSVSGRVMPSAKMTPPEVSVALTAKFDQVRNSLVGFVHILKRQQQQSAQADIQGLQEQILKLLETLEQPQWSPSAAAERGVSDQQALMDSVFGYESDAVDVNDPLGERFAVEMAEMLDHHFSAQDSAHLRQLLTQHMASARVLKTALRAAGPSVVS